MTRSAFWVLRSMPPTLPHQLYNWLTTYRCSPLTATCCCCCCKLTVCLSYVVNYCRPSHVSPVYTSQQVFTDTEGPRDVLHHALSTRWVVALVYTVHRATLQRDRPSTCRAKFFSRPPSCIFKIWKVFSQTDRVLRNKMHHRAKFSKNR